ncbi:hypothetical protein WR25_00989 [Diploscapter pachys]|uniref:Uncharacterized protein n=1 Tax=Diploscapter pachys TaxID=2018661 RepID=A0A2A2K184_9BILA|nr:hypothetical protein WR25_00989 [Diploscapter pachys]
MGAALQPAVTGAKGGEKKPKAPYEAPDSLRSTNIAKILLAVGEGEFDAGHACSSKTQPMATRPATPSSTRSTSPPTAAPSSRHTGTRSAARLATAISALCASTCRRRPRAG